ncbi:DUF3325 domain-containing protein [Methylobacterium frigidaeris]|uniref:Iron transporter n=1 Tax=Methylobacterium frigidaeris TaxID=2038277 RepID=A0AA37M448_9HYPH|nr:DUF3325 domain-containing protein [Methylobacterium frigidaeris]PIK71358.1 iron transporter [Methylobacterium frigidaeris]GJD62078.1 hypothetical protein MPEAHAMD_2227 [Methylobacterium frigidaeris]
MTLLVSLGVSFLGFAALCLSMARHHQAVWSGPPDRHRTLTLRAAGWGLIALSLAAAIRFDGWNVGPVDWLGSLIGAGLLLIVVQSYRPRALLWMTPVAAAIALVAALGSLV